MNCQNTFLLRFCFPTALWLLASFFAIEELNAKSISLSLTIKKIADKEDSDNEPLFEVMGKFINSETAVPVKGVEVMIVNRRNSRSQTRLTSADGVFRFELHDQAVYSITGSKQKFFESEQINISTEGKKEYEFMKVEMPIEEIIENKEYILDGIEFDINSNELNASSNLALQKVYTILRKNPTLSIEIGVHTDSRGNDDYNLELSEQRAHEILYKFQKYGFRDGRLKVKGYGETSLINHCGNEVKCGNKAHTENRRVSMKILGF